MGMFDWLFGKRVVEVHETRNDGLIDGFKAEHKVLYELFEKIVKAANNGRWDTIGQLLEKFRFELQRHVMQENVRLYPRLRKKLGSEKLQSVEKFKSEMDQAGHTVSNFIKAYQAIDTDSSIRAQFVAELESIGAFLVERVFREEKELYPLY